MLMQSMLTVPLRLPSGLVIGVIGFLNKQDTLEDTRQVEGFCEDDIRIAEALANVLSQAILSTQLSDGHASMVQQVSAFREVIGVLSGDSSKSLDQLMDLALSLVAAQCGRLYLIRPEGGLSLEVHKVAVGAVHEPLEEGGQVVEEPEEEADIVLGQGAIGYCALNCEGLNLTISTSSNGRLSDGRSPVLVDGSVDIPSGLGKVRSVVCLPVMQGAQCVGVLQLINKRTTVSGVYTVFVEEDMADVAEVAYAFAAAVARQNDESTSCT